MQAQFLTFCLGLFFFSPAEPDYHKAGLFVHRQCDGGFSEFHGTVERDSAHDVQPGTDGQYHSLLMGRAVFSEGYLDGPCTESLTQLGTCPGHAE